MKVRPEILRSYYAKAFAGDLNHAYEGATFDEFVELLRISYPGMQQSTAASRAAVFGRRDLVGHEFEDDHHPTVPKLELRRLSEQFPAVFVQKSGPVDLRQTVVDGKTQILTCHTNQIDGWSALRWAERWRYLGFLLCKSNDFVPAEPPVPCDEVESSSCDDVCLTTLARSIKPTKLSVAHERPVDCMLFANHDTLAELSIDSPLTHGLDSLRTRELRSLFVTNVPAIEYVNELLAANRRYLAALSLYVTSPFSPVDLPDLPALRRLSVRAYPEFRAAWLDFAGEHDSIAVEFHGRPSPPKVQYELLSQSKHSTLLRVSKGTRQSFELRSRVLSVADGERLANELAQAGKAQRLAAKVTAEPAGWMAVVGKLESATQLAALADRLSDAPSSVSVPATVAPRRRSTPIRDEPFVSWEGHVPPATLRQARALVAKATQALKKIGREGMREARLAVLEECVEGFNELDARKHFIASIEAEDIVTLIDQLAEEWGLGKQTNLADEWREW